MSRISLRMMAPAAAALAATFLAVPAYATETTFANFAGLGRTLVSTNTTTANGTETLKSTSVVSFSFQGNNLASTIHGVSADLVFTATSANSNYNSAFATVGVAYQPLFSGTLSIISTAAYTVGNTHYAAGSNLLSASFTNATFLGVLGQTTAGLSADSTNGSLTYTSDFLTFGNTVSRDYSISLSALTPKLASGMISGSPAYIKAFTATPGGSFSADPAPLSNAVVPEPATWGMMLIGLGAIGLGLRGKTRRRELTA